MYDSFISLNIFYYAIHFNLNTRCMHSCLLYRHVAHTTHRRFNEELNRPIMRNDGTIFLAFSQTPSRYSAHELQDEARVISAISGETHLVSQTRCYSSSTPPCYARKDRHRAPPGCTAPRKWSRTTSSSSLSGTITRS